MKGVCVLFVCVSVAQPAFAQRAPSAWKARVGFNVEAQADTAGLSQLLTLVRNAEPAPIAAELSTAAVPCVDAGILVRLFGHAALGVSFSVVSHVDDADVEASIPHPFLFDRPRSIAGPASVKRREFATLLSATYLLDWHPIAVAILAGAAVFNVSQDLVGDVVFVEAYPYDSASFAGAELTREGFRRWIPRRSRYHVGNGSALGPRRPGAVL